MQTEAGLYIHIPFCQQKCGYCDFYSITALEKIEPFLEALFREIQLWAPQFEETLFRTVYLGGGTPSLLSAAQMEQLWEQIHRAFHIDRQAEITLEANPGSLSQEQLCFLRQLGFNRLSMGVQSFQEHELAFLGRIHTAQQARENFYAAREAGFENINLDLMTAFPGITPTSFRASLEQAVQLGPEHLSCYTLIFEPNTPFYRRMQRGELIPLPEEEEAFYYELAEDFLQDHGFQAYEVSNFARDKKYRCQHNLIYWTYQPYLGLGPSAHSFWNGRRWGNVRSLQRYCKMLARGTLPISFQETLEEDHQMLEYVYLQLRLREGLSREAFREKFGRDPVEQFTRLEALAEHNLVEITPEAIRLTPRGWLLADEVAVRL